MTIDDALDKYDLERSLLIGYYGGGNFGDELLLEVLANLFRARGLRRVSFAYQSPDQFRTFHHDFGYRLVPMREKLPLLRAIFRSKNILIGGGGLWGLDMNLNVFLLSALLFVSRFVLGKKVFLLGVGYYDSTTRLGRLGARLAGKAATFIVARDQETHDNFRTITARVGLDRDIAWRIDELDLSAYETDAAELAKRLRVGSTDKTLFVALRRFRGAQQSDYGTLVEQIVRNNPDKPIILSIMEPQAVDPDNFRRIKALAAECHNVQAADFGYNPLALYLHFRQHRGRLAVIAPQFHAIITAKLSGAAFLPFAYDNKVTRLLEQLRTPKIIPISELRAADVQHFIDEFYRKAKRSKPA